MRNEITQRIRDVVGRHARLAVDVNTIADEGDLYKAGMSSHASVNLLLALEEQFEIEFPERLLRRRSFESIAAIRECVLSLRGAVAV